MKFAKRRAVFIGVGLVLAFIAVELESYAFARLSIASGNSFLFYNADVFDITNEQLKIENTAGPLGWPQTNAARAQPRERNSTCGSAFGDSMTHGDEVNDNEAWLNLLSNLLGCNVQNFGVGGYGLDQTALRYELIAPPGDIVIVGVFIEMLRRDLAASWTFYAGPLSDNLPRYSITKPLFALAGSEMQLISRPLPPVTRNAIEQHHKRDFFLNTLWTPLSFPYSYAAGRAIVRRLFDQSYLDNLSSNQFWQKAHPSHAAELALKLLGRIRAQTKQRDQQLVLVMIPQVEETVETEPAYASFVQDLARREPGLCIVDLHQALAAAASKIGMAALRAPQGHYSAAGNEILAQTVRSALQRCGIFGA